MADINHNAETRTIKCGLPKKNYHFIGRNDVVQSITNLLTLENKHMVVILGPPGCGKSTVISHIGHALYKNQMSVIFVSLRQITMMDQFCANILTTVDPEFSKSHNVVEQARNLLMSFRTPTVLILDNCEDIQKSQSSADFLSFIEYIGSHANNVQLLIGTRKPLSVISFESHTEHLRQLEKHNSALLLKALAPGKFQEDEAKVLGERCHGIPLLINLAAKRVNNGYKPSKLAEDLRSRPYEVFKHKGDDIQDYLISSFRVFLDSLNRELLLSLVTLSNFPDCFTTEEICEVYKRDWSDTLCSLRANGLVHLEGEHYSLHHPFLQTFCREEQDRMGCTEKGNQDRRVFTLHYLKKLESIHRKFVSKEFQLALKEFEQDRMNINQALENAVKWQDKEIQQSCINAFNNSVNSVCKFMPLTQFLEIYYCLYDMANSHQDARQIAECFVSIGFGHLCDVDHGTFSQEAIISFESAYKLFKGMKKNKRKTEAFANCQSKLGLCYIAKGERQMGKRMLQEAFDLRQELRDQVYLAVSHCDKAIAARLIGEHSQAITILIEECLPIYKDNLGDHPWLATVLNYISDSYKVLGKLEDAIEYTKESLEIRQRTLGDHQDTARSYVHLGELLRVQGDEHLDEALVCYQKALSIQEKVLGVHEETAASCLAIADIQKELQPEEFYQKRPEFKKLSDSVDALLEQKRVYSREQFERANWQVEMAPYYKVIAEFLKEIPVYFQKLFYTSTPREIIIRGPHAVKAYEKALEKGKTKNRRLLLVLIGQSCAGKTSLLRSFRGEQFNPNQDSTDCADLHHYCCKLIDTVWITGSEIEDQISFERAISENIAKDYLAEKSHPHSTTNSSNVAFERREPLQIPDAERSFMKKEKGNADDISRGPDVLDSVVAPKPSNVSLQNPEDVEVSLSFNTVETKDDIIKRANDTLRNPEEAVCDDIICTVVDIGGQPVYDVTHPLFISTKGVVVLVHSLKNAACNVAAPLAKKGSVKRKLDDKCSMTNMDHLELWMSFVDMMNTDLDASPENALLPDKLPPVFLACTHADKPCDGQNAKEMSREILKYLERKEHPPGKHLVSSLYLIDNTVSGSFEDEGVKRLRKDICDVAKSLPHMNEDIPIRWMAFEKELLSRVQKEKRFLSIEETRKIAFDCKVNVESDEFITVVNYLHDIREIVYFEDTQTVFIDVQWLINMIRKVITVEPREKWQKEHKDSWTRLEDEGVLVWSLLEHVWREELADDQATIGSLLLIMERFSLVCRWKIADEQDVFLVPAMLWNSSAQDVAELLKDQMTPLIVHFPSSHLPLGIFSRLEVIFAEYCNRTCTRTRQPKFYHNFCRFFNVGEDASFDLVMTSDIRTISIGIINVKKADRHKIRKFSQAILEFLRTKLDEDMRTNFPWMKKMDYKLCIRCPICQPSADCNLTYCPGCTSDSCVHFIPKEEVLEDEDLRCEKNPVCKDTDIPYEYYSHWFPKPEQDKSSISGALKMNEENKRWVVVGVALMKDLLPALRRYLLPKITKHYNDLKASHNIDTQVHGAHLEKDGTFKLHYDSINNNKGKKQKFFDYKVTSEVDFAKIYFMPSMAKFTGIDESCDLSAVLGMLCSASVFTVATQDAAKVVRQNVRNKWGHCNFTEWDETKFLDCFQLMDDLVKTLNLADDQEKNLLRQLKEWKEKGVQLCLGSPVDADLLKLVQNDVAWLIEEVQLLKEGEEEFERVTCALEEFKTQVLTRLQELERGFGDHETRITALECRD